MGKTKQFIKIDPWDTWSMDHTLAKIVVPMLKQLRDTTHGSPVVDWEDRPDHLIGCIIEPNNGETDEFFHQAWEWVLTEMLYAFQYSIDQWDVDSEQVDHDRVKNGFRLFGKYYQNLWD
jgi:hypothetical protein